jgi:phosphoenolpyruvate---glycerone phosphotransferase subunit DhaL
MSVGLDLAHTRALLSAAARAVIADRDRLTKADQEIGDGDHGVGMARGFAAVERVAGNEASSLAGLFRDCGLALMTASGGASGVIFGTLLQGAARDLKNVLDAEALVLALENGLKAVQDRGKARRGDKTMVDALAPAAEAARKTLADGGSIEDVAAAAAEAAAAGVEATRGMVARIGKAASLGERTVGLVDPGALTMSILLRSISETLANSTGRQTRP